jgi:hypothetical protein
MKVTDDDLDRFRKGQLSETLLDNLNREEMSVKGLQRIFYAILALIVAVTILLSLTTDNATVCLMSGAIIVIPSFAWLQTITGRMRRGLQSTITTGVESATGPLTIDETPASNGLLKAQIGTHEFLISPEWTAHMKTGERWTIYYAPHAPTVPVGLERAD